MAHDWARWHKHYDKSRPLQKRLRVVCAQIHEALGECAAGPIRVASVCSGDGRDIIAALSEHPRRADARAWLLDTNEESLRRGRILAASAGMAEQMKFVPADASLASSYAGAVNVTSIDNYGLQLCRNRTGGCVDCFGSAGPSASC